jgi:uncharacterized protein
MALSLYDIGARNYLQSLGAVSVLLEKGLAHCRETGRDPEEIVETRLIADMLPFRFQVMQTAFHSAGAVASILSGAVKLATERPHYDYAGLQRLVAAATEQVRAIDPVQFNAREGQDVVFDVPGRPTRVFTAESFLLSFSLPNLYFHAATAYGILRAQGAPIGKLDFMGAVRLGVQD